MAQIKLTREEAHRLVLERIGVNNLLKHILAVEAAMRHLANHLGEDSDYWGLTGLIHDLDYNETKDDEPRHGYVTTEWLAEYDLPDDMVHAIHAHPGHIPCETRLDWALYAIDPATGFMVACALMHPARKLAALDVEFIQRRFDEKRFAAGASRSNMIESSHLGLELSQFLMLVRDGMMNISTELGL